MDRQALADAAPKWIAIERHSPQFKLDLIAMFVEAILDAIEDDHIEPDTWETMHTIYAIHALVEGRYYAAITFAEMALIDPALHRPPRLSPDSPPPVTIEQIRHALNAVKARPAKT